jgi:hypothetical protein
MPIATSRDPAVIGPAQPFETVGAWMVGVDTRLI